MSKAFDIPMNKETTEPVAPIPLEISRLDEEIKEVENAIHELIRRIEPVRCVVDRERVGGPFEVAQTTGSGVARVLLSLRDRLSDLRRTVIEAIGELEV